MSTKFIFCENEWGGTKAFHLEGLVFSKKFCHFFCDSFTDIFVNSVGIRPSSKVTLAGYKQQNNSLFYQPGLVSKLNLVLWIMPEYNDNISFCWKSKTGGIIKPMDETFEVEDLECWIEGLKPAEYWKQVATQKKSHPFYISNLPFGLIVYNFGIETELRIYLSEKKISTILKSCLSQALEEYNKQSESEGRTRGLIHNYHFTDESDEFLFVRIDTGSAGIEGIRKILKVLAKREGIKKIEIDV